MGFPFCLPSLSQGGGGLGRDGRARPTLPGFSQLSYGPELHRGPTKDRDATSLTPTPDPTLGSMPGLYRA